MKGYAGKCLDDARNSSAKGAKAAIWTCNAADKAQLWTYSNGELVHNGLCLNDRPGAATAPRSSCGPATTP